MTKIRQPKATINIPKIPVINIDELPRGVLGEIVGATIDVDFGWGILVGIRVGTNVGARDKVGIRVTVVVMGGVGIGETVFGFTEGSAIWLPAANTTND